MKMYCTKKDYVEKKGKVVSGNQACSAEMPPYAIHDAYQTWLDEFNRDIQTSLASK
jgi:hypothetical protein